MANTRPLEERWNEIRSTPPNRNAPYTERVRYALLTTGEFRFPASADGTARSTTNAAVATLRRLGYAVEREVDAFDGYVCTNPERDPTPHEFAAVRAASSSSSRASIDRRRNGSGRRSRPVLVDVLPSIGSDLVVVGVSIDPVALVLRDDAGTRYSCAVEAIDPPRGDDAG